MSSSEPPSFSSEDSDNAAAEEAPAGQFSTCPAIRGKCKALSREISRKLGDQPSRRPHNFYPLIEQTTTPNTLITPHTHLFSAALSQPVESPTWAWKQTGQEAYRQTVRQAGGEEGGGGATVVLAQNLSVHGKALKLYLFDFYGCAVWCERTLLCRGGRSRRPHPAERQAVLALRRQGASQRGACDTRRTRACGHRRRSR